MIFKLNICSNIFVLFEHKNASILCAQELTFYEKNQTAFIDMFSRLTHRAQMFRSFGYSKKERK